ncbi:MAG: hypothetical protein Q7U72_01055 [Brevundimonas sp.]|uniref:hypothetical protein n=1 Tax=Brevundimonas sp. TaxID=1871086 RepID=UPI002723EDA9|nr:hypothetical protein [Brevundimonas sp.]MDO9076018.1 hypothetical protein [Brevundimonas sp.]MDZ4061032.1 hypothetical protein [Brevundimonas sp.]
MSEEPKIASVAKVIDDYRVVIAQGSDSGVKLGDKYLIYGIGEEITDPLTNENLGVLEIVRGRAKVVHLQAKLATLQSIDVITTPGKKRVVKRDGLNALMGYGTEEITEGAETLLDSLKDPARGDLARPI